MAKSKRHAAKVATAPNVKQKKRGAKQAKKATSAAKTSGVAASPLDLAAVRERAHLLWTKGGQRAGQDLENWLEAERQLLAERQS